VTPHKIWQGNSAWKTIWKMILTKGWSSCWQSRYKVCYPRLMKIKKAVITDINSINFTLVFD